MLIFVSLNTDTNVTLEEDEDLHARSPSGKQHLYSYQGAREKVPIMRIVFR